jgi:type II secretory pathway pseudopilin PulG
MKKLANESGFSLMELLIIIVIIGTLSSLVLNSVVSVQKRARDAKRRHDIAAIRRGLLGYGIDNGTPLIPNTGHTAGGLDGLGWFNLKGTADYSGNTIEEGLRNLNYIAQTAIDPREGAQGYVVWPCAANDQLGVFAKLENPSEADTQTLTKWSDAGCPTDPVSSYNRNYVLTIPLTN